MLASPIWQNCKMKQTNQTIKLISKVLGHMAHKEQGHQVGGVLLAGDPGIGKTTFVELFGSLLGIKTVIIEVPHITEEHLINIPFIVFNPITNQEQRMSSQMNDEYKLVLAQSNLYTQIAAAEPLSDQQYIEHIKNSPTYIQDLYKHFGGTEDTIPPAFEQARRSFHSILFLDEYYRQTSMRIRNIMRGILNNRIGLHPIPKSTYIMYASNMRDTGLEDIPSNHQFMETEFKTPAAKDWFAWLESAVEYRTGQKLNQTVMQKFQDLLKDEDLSFHDAAADVRTSPRRWEQLLLYINAALPIKTENQGEALLTNVKNNFVNYETGEYSALSKKVVKAVSELIQQTSGHKISANATKEAHQWRETLLHQVEMKMKLGEQRKYIPVVSGPPGIGKTAEAWQVAEQLGLRLIDVDVSEIFPDDVVGLPIPGRRTQEDVTVKFSLPKLYQQIMSQIKEKDQEHLEELRQKYGKDAEKHIEEYQNQRWKYLIFFDEINRVDERTFNALRKVILEKNFGPAGDNSGKLLELPKESIIVAAMNPEGVGTAELTHHFKDVVDVIPARASWPKLLQWLRQKHFKGISEPIQDAAIGIIQAFADKFKEKESTKVPPEQAPFHLNLGAEIYISPREYADMYATLIRELDVNVRRIVADPNIKENEIRDHLDEVIADAMEDSLNFIFSKHNFDRQEFLHTLREWIANLDDRVLGGLVTKKTKAVSTMADALGRYLEGEKITKMPEDANFININNTVNNAQFIEELKAAFASKIKNAKDVRKLIIDEDQPKVVFEDDKLKTSKDKVSYFENLVLAVLYTLHIHQYQHDRLVALGKAISSSASELFNKVSKDEGLSEDDQDELLMRTTQLRSAIHKITTSLK